jgi:hypothetical protein
VGVYGCVFFFVAAFFVFSLPHFFLGAAVFLLPFFFFHCFLDSASRLPERVTIVLLFFFLLLRLLFCGLSFSLPCFIFLSSYSSPFFFVSRL